MKMQPFYMVVVFICISHHAYGANNNSNATNKSSNDSAIKPVSKNKNSTCVTSLGCIEMFKRIYDHESCYQ